MNQARVSSTAVSFFVPRALRLLLMVSQSASKYFIHGVGDVAGMGRFHDTYHCWL